MLTKSNPDDVRAVPTQIREEYETRIQNDLLDAEREIRERLLHEGKAVGDWFEDWVREELADCEINIRADYELETLNEIRLEVDARLSFR